MGSASEPGLIEGIGGEEPEINFVSFTGIDQIKHTRRTDRAANRFLIEIELRLRKRRYQHSRSITRCCADGDDQIDIVRRSRFTLQAGNQRPGKHVLDTSLVQTRGDEFQEFLL
jgi:hypothetical protein